MGPNSTAPEAPVGGIVPETSPEIIEQIQSLQTLPDNFKVYLDRINPTGRYVVKIEGDLDGVQILVDGSSWDGFDDVDRFTVKIGGVLLNGDNKLTIFNKLKKLGEERQEEDKQKEENERSADALAHQEAVRARREAIEREAKEQSEAIEKDIQELTANLAPVFKANCEAGGAYDADLFHELTELIVSTLVDPMSNRDVLLLESAERDPLKKGDYRWAERSDFRTEEKLLMRMLGIEVSEGEVLHDISNDRYRGARKYQAEIGGFKIELTRKAATQMDDPRWNGDEIYIRKL